MRINLLPCDMRVLKFIRKSSHLCVGVEHGKVRHNNWYWESDCKDAGKGTKGSNKHSRVRFRRHVAITDGSHSYNSPPKSFWYTLETIIRIILENSIIIHITI